MTESQRVANPTQFHTSTSPAAGRPKVRFHNLSHKCKTDFHSKKESAFSFSKDMSMQIHLGLVSNELHLFIFKTYVHANSVQCSLPASNPSALGVSSRMFKAS